MRISQAFVIVVAITVGAWVDASSAQERLRRSIEGPLTPDAVTRSLIFEPAPAGPSAPGEPSEATARPSLSAPPSEAPARPSIAVRPSEVSLMIRVEFGFGSAVLTGSARRDLDIVASSLNDPRIRSAPVTLEGHTDISGSAGYNLRLSRRRAAAVVDYLARRGVAGSRLTAVGFGEERPLSEYDPTDGRQRRVEIVRSR